MKKADNQLLVIFGASGDLTSRKLLPSLFELYVRGLLPDRFCMLETANDKGEAMALPGIGERAEQFARNMLRQLTV